MTTDRLGLTWKQQVEYRKVHSYFRDIILKNKVDRCEDGNLRITEDSNAQEVLNDL